MTTINEAPWEPRVAPPAKAEWVELDNSNCILGGLGDLEVRYFYRHAFGKRFDELDDYFSRSPIQRGSELQYLSKGVFQYYIFAFVHYLLSSRAAGDPDAPSVFLGLLTWREINDPGSVRELALRLKGVLNLIEHGQSHFDADVDIYGDFRSRVGELSSHLS